MSVWLQRYLRRHSLEFHLAIALSLAVVLRSLAAYFVYGPQALDDYKHGVWPAYQMFAGLPVDLPEYRNHLLNWILVFFLKAGEVFGIESALSQVRIMYFGLGLISLLAIVGAYVYGREVGSRIFGGTAMYLLAIFPIMPFVSTRAFGESVALAFVVLGLAVCERARIRNRAPAMAIGFFLLGIAVLLRFQVGVISCAYFMILMLQRRWWLLIACGIAGLGLIAAQAGIDIASGKAAFGTLQAYLEENAGGAAKYGASPWYNTWLLVLGLTLFPFSLVFLRRLKLVFARHFSIAIVLLVFVAAHSAVAHKEERFMYPIVGLILMLIAAAWSLNRHNMRVRRIYQPAFLIVTALVLPVACLVNSQAGEIEPAAQAEKQLGRVGYIDYESLFGQSLIQFYFLRPPSQIMKVTADELTLSRAEVALSEHPEWRGAAFLTSAPEAFDRIRALSMQTTAKLQCGDAVEAASPVDRLLFRLNPKHNQRRRPTLYILCERKHD